MILLKYILFNLLFFNVLTHEPKDKNIFIPPLKIPVLLSSNFGELRIDHFHSGIDIKTQGVTGKEVVSSADGYIYRISVSPTGFGKALYVKHQTGYSTVYGHLERFTPEIEEYVREKQYERKSFTITLFPPKEKFAVKQGETIAWSGNSGSSGGPHLHYEVRESDNEAPVNPLPFKIGVRDNIPPVLEKLAIYPLGNNSDINGINSDIRINLVKLSDGKYALPADKKIDVSGNIGFGLKIFDQISGSANKCAAYSIQLNVDSSTIYRYEMDGFSFDESRFVNSHIDYKAFMRDNIYIQKAWVLPNDLLHNYKSLVNRGIYRFNDNKEHKIDFIVTDVNNNKVTLSFKVKSHAAKQGPSLARKDVQVMPYNRTNRFSGEDVSISIPEGALYDTLYFSYRKRPATMPSMLSDIHSVHNKYVPLQKAINLSIKPTKILEGKESKMLLVLLNDNLSKVPVNSTWDDGYVKAEVMTFGNYYVGIDTVSPSIIPQNISPGINLTGKKEIRIRIKDDFSGIKSYDPFIDDKWALFEYDAKTQMLTYKFDEKYISKGTRHNLLLRVRDNRDNEKFYECNFTW
jgi:hypothetical protein